VAGIFDRDLTFKVKDKEEIEESVLPASPEKNKNPASR
jgi:hypothetical protein